MEVRIETEEVDWDSIISMCREINNDKKPEISDKIYCKKCNQGFFNKNYNGKFPLCDKHRNNTFK